MLSIDRSHPFRLSEIESLAALEGRYAAADNDAASQRLTSIDADEIQLIPLTEASGRGATLDSNQSLAAKLARMKGDGSVFLDARALATMLNDPRGVPGHWHAVVAPHGSTGEAGSIRFYGSRFRLLEGGDVHVLGLSFKGGRWSVELEPAGDKARASYAAIVGVITESSWAAGD